MGGRPTSIGPALGLVVTASVEVVEPDDGGATAAGMEVLATT